MIGLVSSFWACCVADVDDDDGVAVDCTELFSFEDEFAVLAALSCFCMIVDTGEVAVALVVVMRMVDGVDEDEN